MSITNRGRVIAELRAPSPADSGDSAYRRLVEEGKVIEPARPWTPDLVPTQPRRPRFRTGYANELVARGLVLLSVDRRVRDDAGSEGIEILP